MNDKIIHYHLPAGSIIIQMCVIGTVSLPLVFNPNPQLKLHFKQLGERRDTDRWECGHQSRGSELCELQIHQQYFTEAGSTNRRI